MIKFVYLLVIIILCSGCATAYKKDGIFGGYTDTRIQDDIFRVSFKGNGYTSSTRATDFALLRGAELVLANGYQYFVIIKENEETKTIMAHTTPIKANTTGNINMYGGSGYAYGNYQETTTYSGGNTFFINAPSANMTIRCFKDKPDIPRMIYDAQQVSVNIRRSYGMKAVEYVEPLIKKEESVGATSDLPVPSGDEKVKQLSGLYEREIDDIINEAAKSGNGFNDSEKNELAERVKAMVLAGMEDGSYEVKSDEDFVKLIKEVGKAVSEDMKKLSKIPSSKSGKKLRLLQPSD